MESIFGLTGKDYVLLAADCKVARSILVYKDDEDKIMSLDRSTLVAGAGPQSDRLEFCEYIQKNMKLYELRNGVKLSTNAIANYVRGQLALFLRKSPYQVNLLIGGCEEENNEVVPSLHWIDYLGSLAKVNYGAHGYGAHFCLSIFDSEWKPNMTLEEGLRIMKLCKAELDERFLVRSGKWILKVVDSNGSRIVEI